MKVDEKLLKCSLTVGALFVVFSHPFLYRALHRQFSSVLAFVDMNMCPTEGGVFVHAILFALTIYFGKQLYDKHYGPKKVKKVVNNNSNSNNNDPMANEIKGKCKVYCENISNEIQQRNNNVEQNLPQQIELNMPNQVPINTIPQVNNNNLANLQNNLGGGNNQMNNMQNNGNNMMNNISGNPNNMQNNMGNNMQNNMGNVINNLANNSMGNNNGLTNNMDYNNVSNVNIMGTQSTEISNLNNQGSLSCGSLPNFTNELGGNDTFSDNTTYVDDMFMRL